MKKTGIHIVLLDGGFIIKNKLSFKLLNDLIHAVDKYLIKNKFNKIFLINTPSLYWKNMDQSLDYLLQWNKYKLQELYISHATNINSSEKIDNLLSKRKRRYMLNDKQLNDFSFQPIQKNEPTGRDQINQKRPVRVSAHV